MDCKAQPVQFAVIPAAGKGTRLLPTTLVVPKELIPVGNKPMIHYAIERIINAGISNIVIVVNPHKMSIKKYLRHTFVKKVKLNFVIQKEPTGLADAIALCHPIIERRPFLLYMPDSFHWGDYDFLRRLLDLFYKTGKTSLGVYPVTQSKAYLYSNCGRIKGDLTSDGHLVIESLGDKRPGSFEVTDSTASYRVIGISVCTKEFFDYIERHRSIHKGGELDDVPIFQMILKERGMVGEIFKGEYFDIGNPQGLMNTQHFLWEKINEIEEAIKTPFEMIVLGSGTAIPHKDRFGPGYVLRINKQFLLFDPSAGTIYRAVKLGINLADISHIFFTHFHPDHIGDLVPLLFALKNLDIDPMVKIKIVGPPGFINFLNHLKEIYGHWIDAPSEKASILEPPSYGLDNQDWSIQWKPVFHTENSIGYRVTHKKSGKIWAYSGDTDYCEEIIRLVYEVDVAVLECSFPNRFKETGHLTPSLAGKIAEEGKVKHLILSHFYPKCDGEDIVSQCREEYSGKITLATDYLRIQI